MAERGRHATTDLFDEAAELIREQLAPEVEEGRGAESVFTSGRFFTAANLHAESVKYNLSRVLAACEDDPASSALMAFQMGWIIGRQEALTAIPTEGPSDG